MDFSWPSDIEELRREAESVAKAAAAGRELREDSWVVASDAAFSRELGRLGWLGMTWPGAYGGHDRRPLERFVVTEALIETGAPIARSWVGDRQIGPTLLAFGTEEQRRRYLPEMVAGRSCWSIGLSETEAGSDVAGIRTRATLVDDHYIVEGAKAWTSFGAEADHCYLIARTDPAARPHRGLSELIVDMDAPGITVSPIRDMTGATDFCEVVFDGVRVPAENLVGEPGGAFGQVMRQLEHERGGVDRLVSNRALYLDARRAADTTDPLVRQEIAAIEAAYLPARLLVLSEVLGTTPSRSATIKVVCTELEQRIATFAAKAFGAQTLLRGRVERAVSYAPAYSIQGGTNSVLRNVIAERTLGLPR